MHKIKSKLIITLALTLIVFLIAGCGDDKPANNTAKQPTNNSSSNSAPASDTETNSTQYSGPSPGPYTTICFNGSCNSGEWIGSYYTDPRYQSQNWLMNSSLMHSRRYGYTPAIQQFVNKMHEQLRAPEYTVDRAFLEKQKEVIASLERFYAESAKFRSHLDPLPVPSSLNQSDIDQDMDPLWRAAGWDPNPSPPVDGRTRLFSDPLKTASEVQNLFSKIANYEKYQDKDRADYLRHELKRMFVNEDGILKSSQYASWPSNLVLGTKFTSTDGLRIRNGINTVMASQSVIGSYCGQSKLDTEAAEACNNFNSFAADLKLGHVLADRLANRGQTESFERLMNTLDAGAKFIQGIASAASDSISSLHEMGKSLAAFGALTVLGYPAAMKMAGNYLYNLASTISTLVLDRGIREKLVADRISESWKTVLHGDAKERGRLTGEIAILMAGFFVDPTRIAGLDSKLIIHAAEITATVKAVDRAIEIDIAAGKLGAQTGRAISEVTREAPYFGKSILPSAKSIENGIQKYGIKTFEGQKVYTKLHEGIVTLPAGLGIKRIKDGSNKIAVIGRTMGEADGSSLGVNAVKKHFKNNFGYEIETFVPDDIAESEWYNRIKENNGKRLPPAEVIQTRMYKNNKEWAEKLRSEGYTMLDVGNPNGDHNFSVFYTMEKKLLFGE